MKHTSMFLHSATFNWGFLLEGETFPVKHFNATIKPIWQTMIANLAIILLGMLELYYFQGEDVRVDFACRDQKWVKYHRDDIAFAEIVFELNFYTL